MDIIQLVNRWPNGVSVDNLSACYNLFHPEIKIGRQLAGQLLRILRAAPEHVILYREENGAWYAKPKPASGEAAATRNTNVTSGSGDNCNTVLPRENQKLIPTIKKFEAPDDALVAGIENIFLVEKRQFAESESMQRVRVQPLKEQNDSGKPSKSSPNLLRSLVRSNLFSNSRMEERLKRRAQENYNVFETKCQQNRSTQEVYESAYKILAVNKNGIRLCYFEIIYEACMERELGVQSIGFKSVDSFFRSRPDLFDVKDAPDPDDVFVYATPLN